jgi:hypothetical protein
MASGYAVRRSLTLRVSIYRPTAPIPRSRLTFRPFPGMMEKMVEKGARFRLLNRIPFQSFGVSQLEKRIGDTLQARSASEWVGHLAGASGWYFRGCA